jgi:hypothetical protein
MESSTLKGTLCGFSELRGLDGCVGYTELCEFGSTSLLFISKDGTKKFVNLRTSESFFTKLNGPAFWF